MSFSDTITITINSVAKVLNRVNQDGYASEYFLRETTQDFRLKLRNTSYVKANGKPTARHNIDFTQTIYAVAPVVNNTVRHAYFVFEDEQGDVIADGAKFSAGLAAFFTEANITKMLNLES
jgi:hypothetical protein